MRVWICGNLGRYSDKERLQIGGEESEKRKSNFGKVYNVTVHETCVIG